MRFSPYRLSACVSALLASYACHPTASDLKVIEDQRQQYKACIIATVLESYAASKPPREAVEAFAEEMAARAPSSNKVAIDKEFTNYVQKQGCDPNKPNPVGNSIVAEWFVSPHNPNMISLQNFKL